MVQGVRILLQWASFEVEPCILEEGIPAAAVDILVEWEAVQLAFAVFQKSVKTSSKLIWFDGERVVGTQDILMPAAIGKCFIR
jgi:hypothetical protein